MARYKSEEFKARAVKEAGKQERSLTELSKVLGVSVTSLRRWCDDAGIEYWKDIRRPEHTDYSEVDPLIHAREKGDRTIATAIGRSPTYVRNRRIQLGYGPLTYHRSRGHPDLRPGFDCIIVQRQWDENHKLQQDINKWWRRDNG